MTDASCIGLQSSAPKGEEAIAHIEEEHWAGESVITGSADMPRECLHTAIAKKPRKVGRYRKTLTNRCTDRQVHLAATSVLQQLRFDGDLGKHMEEVARPALGPFDVVWLVRGDTVQRID